MKIAGRIALPTVMLLLVCDPASAQGLGLGGRGFAGRYGPGMDGLGPGRGVGAGYLPSGGTFLPYTPGPGGGLGVQSRMADLTPPPASGSMNMPGAPALGGLGAASGRLSPMAPITGLGGRGGGMRSGRLLGRQPVGPGATPARARPPVGSYPFRIPPDLGGPAS